MSAAVHLERFFYAHFQHLTRLIESEDKAGLREALSVIRDKRREMFP